MVIDLSVGTVLDNRYSILLDILLDVAKGMAPQLATSRSRDALFELDEALPDVIHVMDTFLAEANPVHWNKVRRLFQMLAEYLGMRGVWQEKLRWGLALMEQAPREGNKIKVPLSLLVSIGTAYDEMADYDQALATYNKIINAEGLDETDPTLAPIYSNLAIVYWWQDRLDEALEYAHRALEMERAQQKHRAVAMSLMNIAHIHYSRWEMAEALQLTQEALAVVRELGDVYLLAQFTSVLATHTVSSLQFDEAVPIYEEAIALLSELHDEIGLARTRFNYGLLLGNILQRKEDARQLVEQAIITFQHYQIHGEAQQAQEYLRKITSE